MKARRPKRKVEDNLQNDTKRKIKRWRESLFNLQETSLLASLYTLRLRPLPSSMCRRAGLIPLFFNVFVSSCEVFFSPSCLGVISSSSLCVLGVLA